MLIAKDIYKIYFHFDCHCFDNIEFFLHSKEKHVLHNLDFAFNLAITHNKEVGFSVKS